LDFNPLLDFLLDIFLDFCSDITLSVWTLFDSSLDRVE
jgi:hypothetical protein